MFEFSTAKPLYYQIADWLENEILKGAIKEGEQIPSQMSIAQQMHVNPLTAAKGVSILESRGIVERRRRGLGLFVGSDAQKKIYEYRKNESLNALLDQLLTEADALGISFDELCRVIEERAEERSEGRKDGSAETEY